jgi:hypothetical protein
MLAQVPVGFYSPMDWLSLFVTASLNSILAFLRQVIKAQALQMESPI